MIIEKNVYLDNKEIDYLMTLLDEQVEKCACDAEYYDCAHCGFINIIWLKLDAEN